MNLHLSARGMSVTRAWANWCCQNGLNSALSTGDTHPNQSNRGYNYNTCIDTGDRYATGWNNKVKQNLLQSELEKYIVPVLSPCFAFNFVNYQDLLVQ